MLRRILLVIVMTLGIISFAGCASAPRNLRYYDSSEGNISAMLSQEEEVLKATGGIQEAALFSTEAMAGHWMIPFVPDKHQISRTFDVAGERGLFWVQVQTIPTENGEIIQSIQVRPK